MANPPLTLAGRWTHSGNSLRIRWAGMVDREATAARIEAVLREHGAAIAYEIFDRQFCLCAPDIPGVAGDPDIAIVLGNAEFDLFFVAQRERGGLSAVSVHESLEDAVRDALGRAMGAAAFGLEAGLVVRRDPE